MYHLIAETADFVVIDKRPGVSVHKDQSDTGLVIQLAADLGYPLWPVHRLDKVTSGLMVFAKSAAVAAELGRAFERHEVDKYYLALSDRKPSRKQGRIRGDMVKARRGSWKLVKSRQNPAVTQFFSYSVAPGVRLFLLRPLTGKTHQLRVALKSLGAPIIGDHLYHSAEDAAAHERTYLHAYTLSFVLQGQRYRFQSQPQQGRLYLNKAFRHCLQNLAEPEKLAWPAP